MLWHCWFGGRKGIRPVKMGVWWRWALISLDGVAPSRMVGMSTSVNLPLHHKVQRFSSGTGSPGWSRKRGGCVCVTRLQNDGTGLLVISAWTSLNNSRLLFTGIRRLVIAWIWQNTSGWLPLYSVSAVWQQTVFENRCQRTSLGCIEKFQNVRIHSFSCQH